MSSHREAPEISKDPVADNADVYAFVSPDRPDTVTLITNFVPLQDPPGGPNFFEFGDDVLYSIYIDNDGDGKPEIAYVFQFKTQLRNPNTFLYNTGPITSLDSPNWNKRQFYSVTRVDGDDVTEYGTAAATVHNGHRHKHRSSSRRQGARPRTWPDLSRRATSGRARPRTTRALGQAAVHSLAGRDQGVRRPAPGRLLRRPRVDRSTSPTCGRSRTCT